ncbi:hypothetical protein PS15m_004060 [Mucor circinelloides]
MYSDRQLPLTAIYQPIQATHQLMSCLLTWTYDSVFELEFAVPIEHDRLIFKNIDASGCFHNFQLQVKRRLTDNKYLTLEENTQHIWALSSIFLLKPGRTHTNIH